MLRLGIVNFAVVVIRRWQRPSDVGIGGKGAEIKMVRRAPRGNDDLGSCLPTRDGCAPTTPSFRSRTVLLIHLVPGRMMIIEACRGERETRGDQNRIDYRYVQLTLKRRAIARHAGTPEDEHVGLFVVF